MRVTGGERVWAPSRISGQAALVRRLRLLLLAAHRYGRGRARSPAEVRWAARLIDALTAALEGAEPGGPTS